MDGRQVNTKQDEGRLLETETKERGDRETKEEVAVCRLHLSAPLPCEPEDTDIVCVDMCFMSLIAKLDILSTESFN